LDKSSIPSSQILCAGNLRQVNLCISRSDIHNDGRKRDYVDDGRKLVSPALPFTSEMQSPTVQRYRLMSSVFLPHLSLLLLATHFSFFFVPFLLVYSSPLTLSLFLSFFILTISKSGFCPFLSFYINLKKKKNDNWINIPK